MFQILMLIKKRIGVIDSQDAVIGNKLMIWHH